MSEPNVSVPAADIRSYTDEEPIGEEALVNFFSNNCRFSAERANEFAHAFFNLNTDKSFLKQLLHGLQESKANGDIYLQKIVPKATLTEVIRLIIALNSLFSIPISNISAVTGKVIFSASITKESIKVINRLMRMKA
uniref:Uncharacterized protein n=1 Tax=Acrobeloides nanus TaxID=290746 RepID=A0A914CP35_9BILA